MSMGGVSAPDIARVAAPAAIELAGNEDEEEGGMARIRDRETGPTPKSKVSKETEKKPPAETAAGAPSDNHRKIDAMIVSDQVSYMASRFGGGKGRVGRYGKKDEYLHGRGRWRGPDL